MNDYPYGGEMGRGPSNFESSSGVNVGGFMIGALIGAGLALLLAPASGGETRRRLGDTARKIGSAAKDKIQDIRGGASENEPQTFGSTRQGSQAGRTTP